MKKYSETSAFNVMAMSPLSLQDPPDTHSRAWNVSYFDYDSSSSGEDGHMAPYKDILKDGEILRKPRWLSSVKDWLSVSEPSAQAMKTQRDSMYKKHGIDPKDPRAAAKLHLPMAHIPVGTTTSTKGPDPERVLQKKAVDRERMQRRPVGVYRNEKHVRSDSSDLWSDRSVKEKNLIAPWDN